MEVENRDKSVLSVRKLNNYVHSIGERWKLRIGTSLYLVYVS
jgi:hypothetical protein